MAANVFDVISVAESVEAVGGALNASVYDAVSVAESVSAPSVDKYPNVADVITLAEYVALNMPFVTQSNNMAFGVCTAQNMFSTSFNPFSSDATFMRFPALAGKFNVSVAGTFVGTVTLQRSFDRGTSWNDMTNTWTAAGEAVVSAVEDGVLYRAGIKTGDYTSGAALVRLSN